VLVHVLTEKGKGYHPAETDLEKHLHDTSAFDIATGQSGVRQAAVLDAGVLRRGHRPRVPPTTDVIAITAAMPGSTGLLPLANPPPDQVLDVGIAEQHAVTAAAGLPTPG
jgi:1-deoxy-D-xylulose-5-phosphate synthase